MSKHHKKPKSRNGSNSDSNISTVGQMEHRHWHALFANHMPDKICDIINDIWARKQHNKTWCRIFGNMTPKAICKRINSVWLDPDYKLTYDDHYKYWSIKNVCEQYQDCDLQSF